MLNVLLVAAGGAAGSVARYLIGMFAARVAGTAFPWGTLAVNLAGCLAMGVFIELVARRFDASNELRLFVATGLLGGFTTFSAFALDFAVLFERGTTATAFGYAGVSVVGSLLAVFAGLWLVRAIL
jgi:CrcB protein